MDAAALRVRRQLLAGAARAYGLVPYDEAYDPELCVCQRERPVPGTDRCEHCKPVAA